jgi:hypothetical protein
MRVLLKWLIVVASVFLVGWALPRPGVNCPESGEARDWLMKDGCHSGNSKNCVAISTQETPNVVMYVYPAPTNAIINAYFVATYAILLQEDCFDRRNMEACSYLDIQLSWFERFRESPHQGMDIWKHPNGYADSMVQAEIAYLYDSRYRFTGDASYQTKSDRAGRAFDWSWDRFGVAQAYDNTHYWYMHATIGTEKPHFVLNAHNKALIRLHDLCERNPGSAWCARRSRGIRVLREPSRDRVDVTDFACLSIPGVIYRCSPFPPTWSYYRANDPNRATCEYHRLNYETLRRLRDRGLDTGILETYASMWSRSFDLAVSMGRCSRY